MKNLTRNTAAVLVVTLFTGLAVFSAIQLGGRLFGTSSANAQTITAVQQAAESEYSDGGDGYRVRPGLGQRELQRPVRPELRRQPGLHGPLRPVGAPAARAVRR